MLTASTSNWSEIYLPIIRAYLGCKHRLSLNQFAPTLFALRSSSDRHRKTKKSHNRDITEKFRISPNSQEETSQRIHVRNTPRDILHHLQYKDICWKQWTISSSRFRPFELDAVPSRRNDFLSRRRIFPPPAVLLSQSGKSADVPFTTEVRPDISIPLPRMIFHPSHLPFTSTMLSSEDRER